MQKVISEYIYLKGQSLKTCMVLFSSKIAMCCCVLWLILSSVTNSNQLNLHVKLYWESTGQGDPAESAEKKVTLKTILLYTQFVLKMKNFW